MSHSQLLDIHNPPSLVYTACTVRSHQRSQSRVILSQPLILLKTLVYEIGYSHLQKPRVHQYITSTNRPKVEIYLTNHAHYPRPLPTPITYPLTITQTTPKPNTYT